jgi:hypothetical protein
MSLQTTAETEAHLGERQILIEKSVLNIQQSLVYRAETLRSAFFKKEGQNVG